MSDHATSSAGVTPHPRRWQLLAVLLGGAFMILLATTISNVAIAPIQRDLDATFTQIQWVLAGYALGYGLLLIPAGRVGDRIGHKRVFLFGVALFTAASVLSAVSTSPAQLIFWQVLQGVAAGILNPPILAIIQHIFAPKETGKAYGIYGAIGGVATASGPLLGGLLIAWNLNGWDWRPVFMLNVPIGVAVFIFALILLPESRGRAGSIDLVGTGLISIAVLLFAVPLVEGEQLGWPAWTFISMVGGLPVLALFAWWENSRRKRGITPLIDLTLFRHRSFSAGVGLSLFYFAGFIGLLFAVSLYLQIGFGRSALATGLLLLPFSIGSMIGGGTSDSIAHKIGRNVLLLGAGLVIVGMAGVIVTVHYLGSSAQLIPALLVAGLGSGLVIAPSVEIVLAGVPWQDAGSAGGVLSTAQRLGQAVGVAVAGAILFGGLAGNAVSAASHSVPQLRTDLAAVGMTGAAADGAVATFTDCFDRQSSADDPTAVPAGCPAQNGTDPVSKAFKKAADSALETNFLRAMQFTVGAMIVAVVLTFLLVFLLPRRPAEPWADAERSGGPDDWSGGDGDGGGAAWSGGSAPQQNSGQTLTEGTAGSSRS